MNSAVCGCGTPPTTKRWKTASENVYFATTTCIGRWAWYHEQNL